MLSFYPSLYSREVCSGIILVSKVFQMIIIDLLASYGKCKMYSE